MADTASQLLTFYCSDELFGFDIMSVQDIAEVSKITYLPMVADYIIGVMNLRGKVIPVIDFTRRLGIKQAEYDEHSSIIVTETNGEALGIKVGKVVDAELYNPDNIAKSPQNDSYIIGYIKLSDRRVTVIDVNMLSDFGRK